MNRVTREELKGSFERYVRALNSLGIHQKVEMQEGSKTYGNAYRVRHVNGWATPLGTSNGYLGMTRREAVDTLHTLARTIEDVLYHQQKPSE